MRRLTVFLACMTAFLITACGPAAESDTVPAGGESNVATSDGDDPDATDVASPEGPEARPEDTEVWEPEPPIVVPGVDGGPPSDAIVLFDGTDLSAWVGPEGDPPEWLVENGVVTVVAGTGPLRTREGFGSVQLHVEWRSPSEVSGEGQGRGNSGVYLMDRYEIQVLDSYENRTYSNGQAGSIYKQYAPLVNASRGPGEWQTYDVVFRAPTFTVDGDISTPASMTILHNGVLIQNDAVLGGSTVFVGPPGYEAHGPREPIQLQDHGNPVSYRNIWLRELGDR